MKERNKPTKSWIEKSKNEIAHEEKYLAKRIELLNDIRIKKLLYGDSEAFKVGYEAGFAKACEILHDFVLLVKRMRDKQLNADMLSGEEDADFIDMVFVEQREADREVDEFIKKFEK